MKIAIIGDIQTYYKENAYESGKNILDETIKALKWVFKKCHEEGVSEIYHLGDLVHFQKPRYEVFERLIQCFNQSAYLPDRFITVVGNHDALNPLSDKVNALNIFYESCDKFWVLENGTSRSYKDTTIHSFNYHEPKKEKQLLEDLVNLVCLSGQTNILFLHQSHNRAIKPELTDIDITDPVFQKFDLIFNGHIHAGKTYNLKDCPPWYDVGSLLEQTAKDITKSQKGFYILELSADELQPEFIPLPSYTRFHELTEGEEIPPGLRGQYIHRVPAPVLEIETVTEVEDRTEEGRTKAIQDFCDEKDLTPDSKALSLLNELSDRNTTAKKEILFKSVEIEGFRTWKHHYQDLNNSPLTYIQGKVGSGKTTIFEAIVWCLYGETLKPGNQDDIIPDPWVQDQSDYQGTRVMVEFELGEYNYLLARHLKYNKETFEGKARSEILIGRNQILSFKSERNTAIWKKENGKTWDVNFLEYEFPEIKFLSSTGQPLKGKSRINKQIEYLLGIPYKQFVNTTIFSPEKVNLIGATDAELRKILEPMFNVGWVDEISEKAKIELANLEREIEGKEIDKEHEEWKIKAVQKVIDLSKKAKENFERERQEEIEKTGQQIKSWKAGLSLRKKNLKKLKEQIESFQIEEIDFSEFYDKQARLTSLQNEYGQVMETAEAGYEFADQLPEVYRQSDLYTDCKKADMNLRGLREQIKDLTESILSWVEWNGMLDKKILEIDHEILETGKQILNNCPLCDAHVSDENKPKVFLRVTKNISQLEEAKKEKFQEWEEYSEKIKAGNAKLKKLNTKFQKAQTKFDQAKEAFEEWIVEKVKQVYEFEINLLQNWFKGRDSEQVINDYRKKTNRLKRKKKELKKRAFELRVEIRGLEGTIEGHEELILSLKEKTFDNSLYETKQKELKALKSNLTTLQKEIEDLKHRAKSYRWVKDHISGARGLKSWIIARKIQRINHYTKQYSREVGTHIEFSVKNGKYSCEVYIEGNKRKGTKLSQGETGLTNLIFVRALNDLQCETSGINILCIDEPFSNMDKDLTWEVNRILMQGTRNVFIITHSENLDLTGSNHLKVFRPKGGLSQIEN